MEKESSKVLICGSESSGKSTLWFQLAFNQELSPYQKKKLLLFYKPQIYHHLLHLTRDIDDLPYKDLYTLDPECLSETISQTLSSLDNVNSIPIFSNLSKYFQNEKYRNPNYKELNFEYFSNPKNLERISSIEYIPTEEDVIYSQKRKTAITQVSFPLDFFSFTVTDVGSQKQERKRWKRSMSNVEILLYVIPLNLTKKEFKKQLSQYQEVISSDWFQKTPLIVIFNKEDTLGKERNDIIKNYVTEFVTQFKKNRKIHYCVGSCYKKDIYGAVQGYLKTLAINSTTKSLFEDENTRKIKRTRKSQELQRKSFNFRKSQDEISIVKLKLGEDTTKSYEQEKLLESNKFTYSSPNIFSFKSESLLKPINTIIKLLSPKEKIDLDDIIELKIL